MIFRDLLEVEHDNAGNISKNALKILLTRTPVDVIEQFYADHGRKEEFQEQYDDLNISNIKWDEQHLNHSELSELYIYPEFNQWVETCKFRCKKVMSNNWGKIQNSVDVISYWEKNHTWTRPIIVIKCPQGVLRLVEGHTRLGTLRGLVEAGVVSETVKHTVWVGKCI